MKKIALFFSAIFLLVPSISGQDVPFSETVSMGDADDQYVLDATFPVYVKSGSTYEIEDWVIHIEIGPQSWIGKEVGWDVKEHFLDVLVSITVSTSKEKKSIDFKSYLNCTVEACDLEKMEIKLFWDHAGEKRADLAGEPFSEETPLILRDEYCEVAVKLISFLPFMYLVELYHLEHETDLECLLALRGLTLEINVDYSQTHASLVGLFREAQEYVSRGDELVQAGEFEKALTEYEKAKTVYDQIGDVVRSETVQGYIHDIDSSKALEYITVGDEFFRTGEFEKALIMYEKAEKIYETRGDEENVRVVQELMYRCTSYAAAAEDLNEGIKIFEEAERTEYNWRAIKKYKEAKSCFEKAKAKFDQLKDQEKSDECIDWAKRCDAEIKLLESVKEAEEPHEYIGLPVAVGIVGIVIVTLVILLVKPAKPKQVKPRTPREADNLKVLKLRLATGEITLKEYEEIKSVLESD